MKSPTVTAKYNVGNDTYTNSNFRDQQAQRLSQQLTNAPGIAHPTLTGTPKAQIDYDANNRESYDYICTGVVVESFPIQGLYKVILDKRTITVECTDTGGRGLPFATSNATPIAVNSRVIVYYQGPLEINVILGVVPDLAAAHRFFSTDNLYTNINHLWHRIGGKKDKYQNAIATDDNRRYFGDARPGDITVLGDVSYSNFMGSLFHMNMWQTVLKTSNACGVWLNLIDELTRVVGKNYQLFTPAGQSNKLTFGGETINYDGQALYDWEGIGLVNKPSSKKGEEWIEVDTELAKPGGKGMDTLHTVAEPKEEKMTPYFRFEKIGGWLGHGGMEMVRSLPKEKPEIWEMDQTKEATQVFRKSLNVAGALSIQAAGGFSIERTVDVPCYQQVYEPYEDDGDSGNQEYKYVGGDGSDKVQTLKVQAGGSQEITESVKKAMGVDDYYTKEKYKSLYAFIKHSDQGEPKGKDYKRVDEKLTIDTLANSIGQLSSNQFMSGLQTTEADAGIFEEQVQYVKRKTGIYATQDGGILIRDAYGNEIKTGVNGIEFNSVSDITGLAQRRVVSMSGDDTIITANKSMDLSAVQNDMRLQAYHNMEITGAISNTGRTVIENRSKADWDAFVEEKTWGEDVNKNGLYLISKDSTTFHYTNTIYTKCRNDAYYEYLKCWNYANDTYEIKSQSCTEILTGAKLQEPCTGGLVVQPNLSTCLTDFHVQGNNWIRNNANVKGSVYVLGGVMGKGSVCMDGTGCFAGGIPGSDLTGHRCPSGNQCASIAENLVRKPEEQMYQTMNRNKDADKLWNNSAKDKYDNERPGHDRTIKNCYFKSRDQKQYGTEKYMFILPQYITELDNVNKQWKLSDYYQAFQREGGEEAQGPFPGKKRWDQECCTMPKPVYCRGDGQGKGNEGKDPNSCQDQNQCENYNNPDTKKPDEAFAAVTIS